MLNHEDHSNVGRTFAHAKASLDTPPTDGKTSTVAGRLVLAVFVGALFGYLLSIIIAPSLALAFMIGGAMAFGAGAVALILFQPPSPDEYASGFARTDEEVRAALAEIEAKKK